MIKRFWNWFLMRDSPEDEFAREQQRYEYRPFYQRFLRRILLLVVTFALLKSAAQWLSQYFEN